MKKMFVVLAIILYAGIAVCQTLHKDNVFTLNVLDINLKPGVTMDQFMVVVYEEYIPALSEAFPDITSIFSEVIRGRYEAQFGLIDLYESEEELEKYWPDTNVKSELYEERWETIVKPVKDKMDELAEYEFVPLTTWKVDFTLDEEADVQSFIKDKVFTRHVVPVDLKTGATMDQFLDVVYEEYIPALKEAFPDVAFLFLKGIRGEYATHFGLIPLYESEEGLEKYWPATGGQSELFTERWTEIVKPVRGKMDELANYSFNYYTIWKVEPTPEEGANLNSVISEVEIDFCMYPNPFSDNVVFEYELSEVGTMSIQVYNSLGQLVATPVNNVKQSGKNSIHWNGCDNSGNPLKEGIYFVQVQTPSSVRNIGKVIKLTK